MAEGLLYTIPDEIACPEIPGLEVCRALLPGGLEFEDVDLLRLVQPALAPLVPMFTIMEVVVAIKACIEAVEDALGPPPDPSKLARCLPDLSRKIGKLLRLLPQFSVPVLLITLIDCIVRELEKLRRFVLGLLRELERISALLALAAELNDPNINLIGACAGDRLAATLDGRMKGLVALGRVLGSIRVLGALVGVNSDAVPDFAAISAAPLAEAVEQIDSTIEALGALRGAIEPLAQAVSP